MLKSVIFDMDGVIVDTEPLHHKAYYQMFEKFNIEVSEDLYRQFTGQSTINVCKELVAHFNLNLPAEELMKTKQSNFSNIFKNDKDVTLIEGVSDLIIKLYNDGIILILASSASHNTINNVFTRFELDQYFVKKLSGADFEFSKPNPDIFIKAAEYSGFKNKNCIVIEDSTNGIEAAKNANLFCVGYKSKNSINQDYSKADIIIDEFNQFEISKVSNMMSLS